MKTKGCVSPKKAVFKIIYDGENGFVVPDNKVADFIKNQIELFQETTLPVFTVTVGSGLIVQAFRLAFARGDIAPEELIIKVNEKEYGVCDCGSIYNSPDEIYASGNIVCEILRHRVEKKTCKGICCRKNEPAKEAI